jgi:hypothetical protein
VIEPEGDQRHGWCTIPAVAFSSVG